MDLLPGLTLLNILSWLTFGIISGVIVEYFDFRKEGIKGTLSTVLIAMGGAFLGGLVASVIFNVRVGGINFQSLLIAIAMAFLFVFLQRAIFRND